MCIRDRSGQQSEADHAHARQHGLQLQNARGGQVIVFADSGFDAIMFRRDRMAILRRAGRAGLPFIREMRKIPDTILRSARIEIDQRHLLRRRHIGHRAPRVNEEAQIGMFIAVD